VTALLDGTLVGSQTPRVLTRPAFSSERLGVEAIEFAESFGLVLDPWQQLLVKAILATRDDDLYAASEAGFLVARQNGKGGVLEAVALHGLFKLRLPLTLWTAHETKTSFEAFQRVKGWIESSPELVSELKAGDVRKGINQSHGDEGVTLEKRPGEHVAPRLRFLARSKSSGRGFSPQRIIFDEAQELPRFAIDAMLPSMRAQPNRQAIFCGTVPAPENNHPEHWTRMRDRGRSGSSGRLMWAEWSPEGSDEPETACKLDLTSERVWVESNPGLGYRVTPEAIRDDLEAMDPDAAARELFSVWPSSPHGEGVFGPAWSAARVSPVEPPDDGLVLGVAVSVDRQWTSLGAAAPLDDGRTLLAAVDRFRGTAGVVREVERIQAERGCMVVIDGGGPSSSLVKPLQDAGVNLVVFGTGDVCDAAADLYDRIQNGGAVHMGHKDLNDAHDASEWRMIGDRRAIGRQVSHADVSMLEAVTLAAWHMQSSTLPAIY
jgi:hypothetical protein